jgi:two-component system, cell cycle response regulator DivK
MSLGFSSGHLAIVRRDAQRFVQRAGNHESQLEALVAAAEGDLRHAETARLEAADADVDQLRNMLFAQAERSAAGAAMAKRLCATAHEQHGAARRFLVHLGADRGAVDEYPNAVLVVDDYGDVRDLIALVLQNAGFVVRTAANGLEALIAAYEMRPAVIVMDVSMPVLDGIEATRLIKATEATRDARVIAHTGDPPGAASLPGTLFAAVLQKPTTPDVSAESAGPQASRRSRRIPSRQAGQ